MTALALTYFPRLDSAQGQRVRTTWRALLARLAAPRVVARKDDAPGISLATYRDDRRSAGRVERVYAVGLDFDHGVDWDALVDRFDATASFLHTTYSSTAEECRARAFLLLSRPVTADEYRRVWTAVASVCERAGLLLDVRAKDASRFWFLPSTPPGGAFRWSVGSGAPVEVDRALASVAAPEPPPPPRPLSAPPPPSTPIVERARAYLAKCAPAISGQGGHAHTFLVAQRLVRGFRLDEATALALLEDWNRTCDPPWSERDLRRKVREAATRGRMVEGDLVDRPRRAS